jgi:hypothetical protein
VQPAGNKSLPPPVPKLALSSVRFFRLLYIVYITMCGACIFFHLRSHHCARVLFLAFSLSHLSSNREAHAPNSSNGLWACVPSPTREIRLHTHNKYGQSLATGLQNHQQRKKLVCTFMSPFYLVYAHVKSDEASAFEPRRAVGGAERRTYIYCTVSLLGRRKKKD